MDIPTLTSFLDEVVKHDFEEDYEVYDFEKEELLSDLFEKEELEERAKLNQFGIPVNRIPAYLAFIMGTLNFVQKWVKHRKEGKSISDQDAKEKWHHHLVTHKLSLEAANRLIDTYFDKLKETINQFE